MKRPRKRLGFVLIALSALLLLGGQLLALATARASAKGDGLDALIPHPAPVEGAVEGAGEKYLVRFLTLDLRRPGRVRLLEHASLLLHAGESGERDGVAVLDVEPISYQASLTRSQEQIKVDYQIQSGGFASSFFLSGQRSFERGPAAGDIPSLVGVAPRRVTGRPTATFPGTIYPPYVYARTVLLVDPAPAGTVDIPFREIRDRESERLIAAAFSATDVDRADYSRGELGAFRILTGLSLFAVVALLLGALGAILAGPGFYGLALWIVLAPLLLAGSDRIAVGFMTRDLDHEHSSVREAAMAGLAAGMGFSETGRERLGRVAKGPGEDAEVAERILTAVPPATRNRDRRTFVSSEDWLGVPER